MSIYEFEQQGGTQRFSGVLKVKGGTGAPGDVPTQQANGDLRQAPGGGSMTEGVLSSAERLFTERDTAGTYSASLPIPAGTVVLDIWIYPLAVWSAGNAWCVVSDAQGGVGSYFPYGQLNLVSLNQAYAPASSFSNPGVNIANVEVQGGANYASWIPFLGTDIGGIRYDADDEIDFSVVVAPGDEGSPATGVTLFKVIYFTPVTAVAATFS